MEKTSLAVLLVKNHHSLIQYVESLPEKDFLYTHMDKWSAGQQVQHIVKSVNPVAFAFGLPEWGMKWMFGTCKRQERTYDELIDKYKAVLANGGKASAPFAPKQVYYSEKKMLLKSLHSKIEKLEKQLLNKNEQALSKYVLPHPLLGKLTLREMCYFTAYHATHHEILIKNYLQSMAL